MAFKHHYALFTAVIWYQEESVLNVIEWVTNYLLLAHERQHFGFRGDSVYYLNDNILLFVKFLIAHFLKIPNSKELHHFAFAPMNSFKSLNEVGL